MPTVSLFTRSDTHDTVAVEFSIALICLIQSALVKLIKEHSPF